VTTFTSYWQNSIDGMSVRGHHARLVAIENALISRGWERTENMQTDVALFDIFSEDFGLQMVRSSSAKMKVWIGNRTAQNIGRILNEVDIYADQDWNNPSSFFVNDKLFVCAPVVDEQFLNKMKLVKVKKNNTTLLIPGGNKKGFFDKLYQREDIIKELDDSEFHFHIAENMDREELMQEAMAAQRVICTPSVVAMEISTLGVLPELIVTSVDQVGNFMNQQAMIRGFEGGLGYLVSQIISHYMIMENKNG
jgi:hypothetical protein